MNIRIFKILISSSCLFYLLMSTHVISAGTENNSDLIKDYVLFEGEKRIFFDRFIHWLHNEVVSKNRQSLMNNLKTNEFPFNQVALQTKLLKFAMKEVKKKLPKYDICSYATLSSSVNVIFDSILELKQCVNRRCSDDQVTQKTNVLELKINSLERFITQCRTHMNSL